MAERQANQAKKRQRPAARPSEPARDSGATSGAPSGAGNVETIVGEIRADLDRRVRIHNARVEATNAARRLEREEHERAGRALSRRAQQALTEEAPLAFADMSEADLAMEAERERRRRAAREAIGWDTRGFRVHEICTMPSRAEQEAAIRALPENELEAVRAHLVAYGYPEDPYGGEPRESAEPTSLIELIDDRLGRFDPDGEA